MDVHGNKDLLKQVLIDCNYCKEIARFRDSPEVVSAYDVKSTRHM